MSSITYKERWEAVSARVHQLRFDLDATTRLNKSLQHTNNKLVEQLERLENEKV